MAIFKAPLPWRPSEVGGWCLITLASLALALFEFRLPDSLSLRGPAIIGAWMSLVGAASWVLVALTTSQGDPVINITGLLSFVGVPLLSFSLFLASVSDGFSKAARYSWGLPFALAQGVLYWLSIWTLGHPSQWDLEGWYMWGPELGATALDIVQVAVVSRMRSDLPAKGFAQISGWCFAVSFFSFLLMQLPQIMGIALALIAGVLDIREFRQRNPNADHPSPALS